MTSFTTTRWVTDINLDLEQWRSLAAEWIVTIKKGKDIAINSLGKFLYSYLHERNFSKVPAEFLKREQKNIP